MMMRWTEGRVGRILARHVFKTALCVLPNTVWTGEEVDLLVVPPCCRVVDVEIKISRADLKRDAEKDKWWKLGELVATTDPSTLRTILRRGKVPREFPRRTWKHYYAMPAVMWKPSLMDFVAPVSGVILLHDRPDGKFLRAECIKKAKANKDAKPLDAYDMRALARLASLRMWDSYHDYEKLKRDMRSQSTT